MFKQCSWNANPEGCVWQALHNQPGLGLFFFLQVGRQLAFSSPRNPPPFRLCRRSLLSSCWSLGQCLPSPGDIIIRCYILPSCSSSSQFHCGGSVFCWPAWLCPEALQGCNCSTISHQMPLCVLHSISCFLSSISIYQLCLLSCNHFKVHNQTNLQMLLF